MVLTEQGAGEETAAGEGQRVGVSAPAEECVGLRMGLYQQGELPKSPVQATDVSAKLALSLAPPLPSRPHIPEAVHQDPLRPSLVLLYAPGFSTRGPPRPLTTCPRLLQIPPQWPAGAEG